MSGTWMQSMVQAWLVFQMSHSAAWLGLISFCQQLPAFIVSPIAGVIADHGDRRKILIAVETFAMIQAFILAGLVFSGHTQLWHVAALSVVLGVANAFDMTTRHALTVDLVGKVDLMNAISLNSVIINGSRILGPALAGPLIALIGEGWCFMLNGVSYLAVLAILLRIRLAHAPTREMRAASPLRIARITGEIAEAAKYSWRHPRIRRFMGVAVAVSLVAAPISVLLPLFAKGVLHGDERTLGLLSAMTGLGGVSGALLIPPLSARFGASGARPFQLSRLIAICLIAMGLALAGFGLSSAIWFSSFCIFLMGFFMMGIFPSLNNGIQQAVEDRLRGRVLSLYTMTFLGAAPLGSLVMGWLSDHFGASPVSVGASFGLTIPGAYLLGRSARSARRFAIQAVKS